MGAADGPQLLDLALAEQGGGHGGAQRRDQRLHHLEVERFGEADGFLEALLGRAQPVGLRPDRVHDDGGFYSWAVVNGTVGQSMSWSGEGS